MTNLNELYDVLVIGGGNAALCAAITARQAGASVLVLEHAPREFRGGNSRHTRNLRAMHLQPTATLTESYSEADYWTDLLDVTGGKTDEHLARITIRDTTDVVRWMETQGAHFQPSLSGTLNLSRTNAFFLGGGKALMNAYYLTAERLGIKVAYNAEVKSLRLVDGAVQDAVAISEGAPVTVRARSIVVASGGFQANVEWLREYWGDAADNFIIRGTPFAKGLLLRNLLDQGVAPIGDPKQCHAVAIDARAPKFDGGIVTRLDCIPFSIVVDHEARRFYDEGEDIWPKRYAIWGRLVAMRPKQIAYAIMDSKSEELFMPSMYPAIRANSIRELAHKLGLDENALEKTVREFNAAVQPGTFNSGSLDDCRTAGINPPKTHWARVIDTPPFIGYPLRPGITFTYLGVKVDENARVLMSNGQPCANLFAAGEIMAGNILGEGYMAGIGMAIGSVLDESPEERLESLQETENVIEARRLMVICNSCRYCEGFCAVFPAMEMRRSFSSGDLSYLANLCHDCRGCYYACQYAPPHEFALNLPQTLARLRADTYAEYVWPRPLAAVFQRNGTFVSLLTSLAIALVLILAASLRPSALFTPRPAEPGAFYAVIPEVAMVGVASMTFGFAMLALAMGFRNFWRDTGGGPVVQTRSLLQAFSDVLTLRNLGGGGHGCNNRDEAFSQARRYAHQSMFYGFMLCFASTCTAAFYEHVLGLVAPYRLFSLPVLLGMVGGLGMLLGTAGLIWVKVQADPAPAAKAMLSNDYALLAQLFLAAATGLLLLISRDTRMMGVLLALHLGVILSFFLALPYSKFVHGIYRSAALLRNAAERPTK